MTLQSPSYHLKLDQLTSDSVAALQVYTADDVTGKKHA